MNIPKFKVMNFTNTVLLVLVLIQYYLLGSLNKASEKFINVAIDLDSKIKLIPGFILPYVSVYLVIIFLLILIARKREKSDMTVFLFSVLILFSIINFMHGFFPVNNFIRPEIKDTGFFFEAVNSLYKSVNPFNTLPNWHTATAVLCAVTFYRLKFRRFPVFMIWIVLVAVSPVFLKMTYLMDFLIAVPLPFLCYSVADKISTVTVKTETIKEVVKIFSLESLIQSVAIGIRDENTISSLIDNLTRIEKNQTENDLEEMKLIGKELNPPVQSLKEIINKLILSINVENQIDNAKKMFGKNDRSYVPTDKEVKESTEDLITEACRPFDNPKFRFVLLEMKKRNTGLINKNSIEEAAKERSAEIIKKFTSFIESHKEDIPAIKSIWNNTNGHVHVGIDDIKIITRELRKPPYEITTDEIWNAYYRLDNTKVKPLGDEKNPANIITLTKYAIGKIENLDPYTDDVDRNFNEWIKENESKGRKYSEEEMVWLNMMKSHISAFMEINMLSFNQPPFVNKGGAAKAYNIFGPDLNRILYELNEKLI